MSDSWDCNTWELSDIVGSTSNSLGQRGTMLHGTLSLVPRRKVASSGPTFSRTMDTVLHPTSATLSSWMRCDNWLNRLKIASPFYYTSIHTVRHCDSSFSISFTPSSLFSSLIFYFVTKFDTNAKFGSYISMSCPVQSLTNISNPCHHVVPVATCH